MRTRAVVVLSLALTGLGLARGWAAETPAPLVARYDMEPDAADARKLVDAGPGKLDGLLLKGASYAEGHRGKALRLDGTAEGRARVDNKGLLGRIGAAVTLTAWISVDALPAKNTWVAILSKRENGGANPFALGVGDNGGLMSEGATATGWEFNNWSGPAIALHEWVHVAATYQAGGEAAWYVNGKEIARKKVEAELTNNDQPLTFGRDGSWGDPKPSFRGLIDDVRVYGAALTPAQVQADMAGTLETRPARAEDFPAPRHRVKLSLARFDMPMGLRSYDDRLMQTAERKPGPDAVDWPALTLDGKPLFQDKPEETRDLPLREDPVNRPLFQQPYDHVIQPGNHWLRAVAWIWGQRYAYTTDRTARTNGTEYELWTFPVKIQGAGPADVKDVVLTADGKAIYRNAGPLHALTLLLPQNEPGKPYQLTVAGRGPVTLNVGLQAIQPGSPKDLALPVRVAVPGAGPVLTVAGLDHPATFPNQKAWDDDVRAMAELRANLKALQARRNAPVSSEAPLVASYNMARDPTSPNRLVDAGALGLHGALEGGAQIAEGGRTGTALRLDGQTGRATVASPGLIKGLSRQLTIAAWVKLDELPPAGKKYALVTKRPAWWSGTPFGLYVGQNGEVGFEGTDGSSWDANMWSPPALKAGVWQQVVLSYKAGEKEALYIDGKEVASKTAPYALAPNDQPVFLGYEDSYNNSGAHLKGLIGSVRLFAEALSAAQVQQEMAGTLKTRTALAAVEAPLPALRSVEAPKRAASFTAHLGVEVPRSPISILDVCFGHGMSGGHFYHSEQSWAAKQFDGSADAYAAHLANLGVDRNYEHTYAEGFADPDAARSYERWIGALQKHGVQGGLFLLGLSNANQAFYSYSLPDFHQPHYREAQLLAARMDRFPNFAGAVMGTDNAGYVPYWDWAPPIPNRPWGRAFTAWAPEPPYRNPAPAGANLKPGEYHADAKTFAAYIDRYDETFKQYGYFARAVREIDPRLMLATGSFGSSPGVGGPGGWPWATVPGKAMHELLPAMMTYDWNEQASSKPMHNPALIDRLRSYYPDKPAWAIIDDFGLFFGREPRQRAYALALTRGVKAIGTQFNPNPAGDKARPDVVSGEKELYAWIHRYGGAYAMTEPAPAIGVMYVHQQALTRTVDAPNPEGDHEGKTTEALFLCHAAGWPAKIVTPEELQRGLPPSTKALLLVGLNKVDDTWHWYDGLTPKLDAFVKAGGRILLDHESVCPVAATPTGMKVAAYVKNSDEDQSPLLFSRNADNIARLRDAMKGVPAPVAVSSEPTVWAVPTTAGDLQYVTVVNWAAEPGKSASKVMRPQIGQIAWSTTRPIYDVRAGRKLTPSEAEKVDLTTDAFQYYALLPAEVTAPKLAVTRGADGFYQAAVTVVNGKPMAGIPVELSVSNGKETATVYTATGLMAKLPLSGADAAEYTVTARELLSGLTAKVGLRVPAAPAAKAVEPVQVANPAAVAAFAARRQPLAVALTPEQATDAATRSLAEKLARYYAGQGRSVKVTTIEPNGLVRGLQIWSGTLRYPQWRTEETDLVLLGSPADNLLLMDQARAYLLPKSPADMSPGEAAISVTFSPFVGEYQALNIVAADSAGVAAGVGRVAR